MPPIASLLHGYFSGSWRKNPLLFGVSALWQVNYTNTTTPAGANDILIFTPAANRIYVATFAALRYDGTVPQRLFISFKVGTVQYPIYSIDIPVTLDQFAGMINVPFDNTGTLQLVIENATLNDDVHARIGGYYMDTGA